MNKSPPDQCDLCNVGRGLCIVYCTQNRTLTIIEKVCPQCGHLIELFSINTQMPCENCGFVACNDTLSCVQWCQYARKCVGDEMYEHMMEIAQAQKVRG